MRRSRAEEDTFSKHRFSQEIIRPLPPEPMIDWGLALSATPRCCVCGEAYVQPPGENLASGKSSNKEATGKSPFQTVVRRGPGGDESFVVLPDSAPVLSESYFSLSRTGSTLRGVDDGIATVATHPSHEMSFTATDSSVGRRYSRSMSGSGDGSMVAGPRMLDFGYASVLGGWTGSGFGTASSMLESIVQISHAGLSDNVRRESILHYLSKRSARPFPVAVSVNADGRDTNARRDESNGTSQRRLTFDGLADDEGSDPTLCVHCYVSLLERIDEDCRLAERDTLAYRDFIEVLDNIDDELYDADRGALDQAESSPAATGITPETQSNATSDASPALEHGSIAVPTHQRQGLESDLPLERPPRTEMQGSELFAGAPNHGETAASRDTTTRANIAGSRERLNVHVMEHSKQDEQVSVNKKTAPGDGGSTHSDKRIAETKEGAKKEPTVGDRLQEVVHSSSSPSSPFVDALRMAEQTSAQLRAELISLENQREALCARGSETWAILSDLSYTRGVLGDECRELLKSSAEVAQAAWDLAERPALSELFAFRHVDGFSSINGYRLGRAPDERRQLRRNEINAAWGQAVLLVRCVSNAIDFHSKRFRLVPLNCSSRIVELANPLAGVAGASGMGDANASDVVFSHNLFSSGGRGDDKHRLPAAIKAFLACFTEVVTHVETRLLERRSGGGASRSGIPTGELPRGFTEGLPYHQTEDGVGGVLISSLKSQSVWKVWLCQLVKNLEWSVRAASSLCVT